MNFTANCKHFQLPLQVKNLVGRNIKKQQKHMWLQKHRHCKFITIWQTFILWIVFIFGIRKAELPHPIYPHAVSTSWCVLKCSPCLYLGNPRSWTGVNQLNHMKMKNSATNSQQPSLASWPISANTSFSTVVILALILKSVTMGVWRHL